MESATVPGTDPTHTTPSERVWEIDCYIRTDQGLLPDPVELDRAMVACGSVLAQIGGVMSMAAVREEVVPGRTVTTKILVKWNSFAPRVQGVMAPAPVEQPPASPPVGPGPVAASANGNGDGETE